MDEQYCPTCQTGTAHRKLPRTGFFIQCAAALVAVVATGSGIDLREPEYECLKCGGRNNG